MKLVGKTGRRKGEKGITIQLIDQKTNQSKSITTHGLSLQQMFTKLKQYLNALEKSKGEITIIIEGEK